jgi:hypothetical protein
MSKLLRIPDREESKVSRYTVAVSPSMHKILKQIKTEPYLVDVNEEARRFFISLIQKTKKEGPLKK